MKPSAFRWFMQLPIKISRALMPPRGSLYLIKLRSTFYDPAYAVTRAPLLFVIRTFVKNESIIGLQTELAIRAI
jgi:hypothetical protein